MTSSPGATLDPRGMRFTAAVTAAVLVVVLVTGSGWLALAQAEHGHLAWRDLFGDATRTAEEGFVISPRLGRMLQGSFPEISQPDVQAYFAEGDGTLLDTGDRVQIPRHAGAMTHDPSSRIGRSRQRCWRGPPACARIIVPDEDRLARGIHDRVVGERREPVLAAVFRPCK